MPAMSGTKFSTVEEYFSSLPKNVKIQMQGLRNIIIEEAPQAEEVISYNMPAFKLNRILLYYAAHKEHIGLYPGNAKLIELFKDELKDYNTSKGTIQFPFDKPLPVSLIRKIVRYRVKENLLKAKTKKK